MKAQHLYPDAEAEVLDQYVEEDSLLGTALLKQWNDHLYIETILKMAPPSNEDQFVGNEYFVG